VGAPYAHVTAPLRRLADRHANEVVLATCAGVAPPEWAVAALPDLVTVMPRANQRASAVNRACLDAVEVVLLSGHEGGTFRGTVVDRHRRGVVVMLTDLPVVATVPGSRELGDAVTVRLEALDVVARTATFALQPH
jgi:exoribonuclease R